MKPLGFQDKIEHTCLPCSISNFSYHTRVSESTMVCWRCQRYKKLLGRRCSRMAGGTAPLQGSDHLYVWYSGSNYRKNHCLKASCPLRDMVVDNERGDGISALGHRKYVWRGERVSDSGGSAQTSMISYRLSSFYIKGSNEHISSPSRQNLQFSLLYTFSTAHQCLFAPLSIHVLNSFSWKMNGNTQGISVGMGSPKNRTCRMYMRKPHISARVSYVVGTDSWLHHVKTSQFPCQYLRGSSSTRTIRTSPPCCTSSCCCQPWYTCCAVCPGTRMVYGSPPAPRRRPL